MNDIISQFLKSKGLNSKYRGFFQLRTILLRWGETQEKGKLLNGIAQTSSTNYLALRKNIVNVIAMANLEEMSKMKLIDICNVLYEELQIYKGDESYAIK